MKTLICLLAVLCMAGGALLAQPVINATQTDALIIDNGNTNLADPNDRIRYKATIQNTGTTTANGVQLNAAPDANTTFVSNSFVTTPVAANDAYTCTGNVGISVPAGSGVKANDYDDALASATLSVVNNPTSGSVTLNNDGSFTYTPNAGFTGSDQFTYGINDATPIAGTTPANADIRATVSITVSDMIWFVDNTGGGTGGTGTLANPFKTLANFNGSAGPQAGHVVFVKHTGTTYRGGIVLKNNMYLFGSGHTGGSNLADSGVLPFTVAANSPALPAINGTRTVIINDFNSGVSPFYGITLASGNTIRGINVGRCESSKIYGNNFGTLTIGNTTNPDVELSGNNYALDLTNGTFAATSKLASINSPDSSRILLNTVSGSLASASTAVTAHGSGGSITVNIQNSSAALDFGATTVNNFNGGTCISITNSGTGSVTFSNLSLPYAGNGTGLVASTGGTINIGGTSSTITGRPALDITSTSFGSGATFASITSNNFFSKAVNLDNVSGPLTINGGSISASTFFAGGIAFDVNGGSSNITYAGSITYPSPSTDLVVEITGRTGGTVTFSGTINATSGTGINVASNTGGTINFSGSTKTLNTGANTAVTLSSNSGATINFTGGGLDIDCTSATAFNATGGATAITVQGTGNTITSTTGTALNVASTTIGASGLTFQSISSSGGSATGIILDNTGTVGGLTVTGDGTNTSVGGNGTGGTISGKSGADASTTTGIGIYLNNTRNVVLRRMTINGTNQNFGIRGSSIVGLTIEYCTVGGTNGDNAGADEGSVILTELTGSAAMTNCNISGAVEHNVSVINTSGTLNRITVTGSTFGAMNTTTGSDGLLLETMNNAVINATITNNNFTFAIGDHCQLAVNSSSTCDVIFTGNTVTNTGVTAVSGGGGIRFVGGSNAGTSATGDDINASLTFDVSNNTMRDSRGTALAVNKLGGSGNFSGTISNNVIGVAGVDGSGSAEGSCIFVLCDGPTNASSYTASITGNTVRQYGNYGIFMQTGGSGVVGSANMHLTVTGNTASNPSTFVFAKNGIHLSGGASPGDTYFICLNMGGAGALANAINSTGTDGGTDFRVRQRQSTTVRLPGYTGANNDDAAVVTFLQCRNGCSGGCPGSCTAGLPTGSAANTVATAGGGFVNGAACNTP